MKKALIVLLLLAVVAGGVFAQLSKEIVIDYGTDLFAYTTQHYGDSQINALTTNKFDGYEMRLNLTYINENVKGYIQVNMDSLLNRMSNTGGTAGAFANNDVTWVDLLQSTFGDYYVDANADMFGGNYRFYLGNTADRGKVERFQDFHDFMGAKIDNYGILVPRGVITRSGGLPVSMDVNVYALDINNFQQTFPHGHSAAINSSFTFPNTNPFIPWFGFFANYAPFTVAIAGSMNDATQEVSYYDSNNDGEPDALQTRRDSYRKINGMLRISGEKIADLVTFDFIYRVWNYDPTTFDNWDELKPVTTFYDNDGMGMTTHAFGLYANLFVMDGLGIGVGYSGSYKIVEDSYNPGDKKTYETKTPLLSGIDLRFKYTGVEQFTFTFNNNISFSGMEGEADDGTVYAYDNISGEFIPEHAKYSWFALYNALAVAYKVSDPFTVKFQVGSRFATATSSYSNAGTDVEAKASYHRLAAALFAQYAFNTHFEFRFGLAANSEIDSYDITVTSTPAKDYKLATFTFGIPVGVVLKF